MAAARVPGGQKAPVQTWRVWPRGPRRPLVGPSPARFSGMRLSPQFSPSLIGL